MTKAILVIDIPDDIWANKEENLRMYAEVWTERIDDGWCSEYHTDSLKPLPQKINELSIENTIKKINGNETILLDEAIKLAKQIGYNTCIDEILGEEE